MQYNFLDKQDLVKGILTYWDYVFGRSYQNAKLISNHEISNFKLEDQKALQDFLKQYNWSKGIDGYKK